MTRELTPTSKRRRPSSRQRARDRRRAWVMARKRCRFCRRRPDAHFRYDRDKQPICSKCWGDPA